VLLAEDSRANQLVATTILRKAGFRVQLAENGLQAVAAVNRHSYGLVLMDVAMPEMDGLEATGCIRALPGKRGRVPIVAMTANPFDEDRQRCLAAGMDDYLTKPIERRALYEAMLRWLDPNASESPGEPALELLPRRSETDWSGADPIQPRGSDDAIESQAVIDSPLDEHVIAALAADLSDELMPTVVSAFIEEAAQRLNAIARAAAAGDATLAADEGHALKGSAATFGASALRATAFVIEQAGRNGSIEGVRAHIDALRNRGEAVITLLRERFCTESNPD
jgi:CheY-like chemotaxis protein